MVDLIQATLLEYKVRKFLEKMMNIKLEVHFIQMGDQSQPPTMESNQLYKLERSQYSQIYSQVVALMEKLKDTNWEKNWEQK